MEGIRGAVKWPHRISQPVPNYLFMNYSHKYTHKNTVYDPSKRNLKDKNTSWLINRLFDQQLKTLNNTKTKNILIYFQFRYIQYLDF